MNVLRRMAEVLRIMAGKPAYWVRMMVRSPLSVVLMLPLLGWYLVMTALIANILDRYMSTETNLVLGLAGILLGVVAFPAAGAASEEMERAARR